MVSRIEVIPSEVRGYGNIVEAKSLSDFVPVESDLVYSENVYSLTAVSGVHISLTASSSSINVGSSVTLTATVIDGDTPVSGETVTFYDGETSLGTDTTDSDGVATLSTSSLSIGSHSCTAVYDEYTSNVVTVTVSDVPVPSYDGVSLTSDKSILSYADSDSCTLTAQLLDGSSSASVSGVTVEFFNGSTSLGTAETNSSGVATKVYSSAGVGDISLTAEAGTFVSETYSIEDCWYYNDGTNTTSLECPTGVSVTTSDGYLVLPKPSSEKIITVPKSLANSDNWEYSVKIARKDGNKVIGLTFNDSTYYLSSNNNTGKYYCHFSSDEYWSTDSAVNDVITVRRQNGITKILINTVEQTSKTVSHKSSFKCGFYTISSIYQYVDEIKLKPL